MNKTKNQRLEIQPKIIQIINSNGYTLGLDVHGDLWRINEWNSTGNVSDGRGNFFHHDPNDLVKNPLKREWAFYLDNNKPRNCDPSLPKNETGQIVIELQDDTSCTVDVIL